MNWRVWGWPAVLGATTLAGLLAALLGEGGAWWAVSWIALSLPLLAIVVAWRRSLRHRPPGVENHPRLR